MLNYEKDREWRKVVFVLDTSDILIGAKDTRDKDEVDFRSLSKAYANQRYGEVIDVR